jgi:hypothetical protein
MRSRERLVALALVLAGGCAFNPSGGEVGDDDVDPGADAADGADAAAADGPPTIDAPAVAIDAAVDARPACPVEYAFAHGGSRYAKRPVRGIDLARLDCSDDLAGRTRLATFENPADLAAVMNVLAQETELLWVGARCQWIDFQGCAGPGSWSWDTTIDIETSMWIPPEPDNPFSELNAVAGKRTGGWGLRTVGGLFPLEGRPYVCECSE